MPDEITLEVELDLPLDTTDIARFNAYVADGYTRKGAAERLAQDILGGGGAVVQGAEAVFS